MQLNSVKIERDNNVGASTILTELVQTGEVAQGEDGKFRASKRKHGGPNVIGNADGF